MNRVDLVVNAIRAVESAENVTSIIDSIRETLAALGSQHFLLTQLPMPGHNLDELVVANEWYEVGSSNVCKPKESDLLIQKAIDWNTFIVLKDIFFPSSPLCQQAGLPRDRLNVMIMPIDPLYDIQAAAFFSFEHNENLNDEIAFNNISYHERVLLKGLMTAAFIQFHKLGKLNRRRGQLSTRQRQIITYCGLGMKTSEIAKETNLSERTVICHIQNSMQKLKAANRTECVIQAIRYNQIGTGSQLKRGFFEVEAEVLPEHDLDKKAKQFS